MNPHNLSIFTFVIPRPKFGPMAWASQGVVYPQVLRQDLAHVLQGDIACVVPITIVDQLEMVYVQDDALQGSGRAQSPFNFEMQHVHHKVGAGHPLAVAYKVHASLYVMVQTLLSRPDAFKLIPTCPSHSAAGGGRYRWRSSDKCPWEIRV